jgi:hypothetical protein
MSISAGFTEKVVIDGATPITQATTITADKRISFNQAVPIGTDVLVALVLDVSQVKAIAILSDQDVTIKTNSSGSPANTLALKANAPYIWYTNKLPAFVFTTDITAMYLTNIAALTLKMEILVDPTV